MKMWSMNNMILLLFCYACLSTSKGKVFFVSKNFFNVLHWDSAEPDFPGQKLLYSVRNQKHGEEQYNVKQCQNISTRSCDLTEETPPDYNIQYAAQVFVTVFGNTSSLGITKRFKPIAETTFGSPTLSIGTNASTLFVNATPPVGPKNESIADIIARNKKGGSRSVFLYTIKFTHPEWGRQVHHNTSGQFVINLRSQTQYCGFVVYKPSAEWGREESEKERFCVTMPGKPQMFLHWIILGVTFLAALIIIIPVVCACTYVKGGKPKKRPQALETLQKTHKVVQLPDKNLIVSEVVLQEKTVYATIRMKPTEPAAGSEGYSPQDVPWRDSDSGSSSEGNGARSPTPNTFNTSAQSSDIYSSVAVQVSGEESEDRDPRPSIGASGENSKKTPGLLSHRPPPLPDPESNPARPIMLRTVRDSNGALMLPSLTLQLHGSDGDPASPLGPERRPLLSDLIDSEDGPSLASLDMSDCSDSGCDVSTLNTPTHPYCNSNYLPSQPVTSYLQQGPQRSLSTDSTSEVGYTPNGMSAPLLGTASTDTLAVDSCEYRKTNFPWNWTDYKKQVEGKEDERSESVEGSRQISLGSWVLQIQE